MNTDTVTQKKGRKSRYETEFDAAVKLQYSLMVMRTGEEPELPSAMEKRLGVEAAKQKMLELNTELEEFQLTMAHNE